MASVIKDRVGLSDEWFLTPMGVIMGVYLAVASLVALGLTTSSGQVLFSKYVFEVSISEAATVPGELYLAGFIGSLAFVWARIVVGENDLDGNETNDTEQITTVMLYRMFLGLIGPLPLVFGVYILAGALTVTESVGLLGAAFLTGMFVKLIYETFRALVLRVTTSPIAEERETRSGSTTGSTLREGARDPVPGEVTPAP